MVGMMAADWAETAVSLLNSARSSGEIPAKLRWLRQLKEVLLHRDPSLLPDFAPRLAELQADRASPVRKLLAEMIGDIGMKHMELLPEMIPSLIYFLKDSTPAVARQAIITGTYLFRNVLEKGLCSSDLDDSLKSSWAWMLKYKNAVLPIAVQPGSDGVRLLAVKFIEAIILLYTPDPDVSSDPPHEACEGMGFNISWLRGGHPLLNVGDLAMEASQSLRLLLDQLRFPQVKSLSNSIVIVLINSLSAIAEKRPSFYGRILPVLLGLDPASSVIKGVQVPNAHHALKNAFMACLKCTHSSAEPWRARLVEALKAINAGELAEPAVKLKENSGGIVVRREELSPPKDDKVTLQECDERNNDLGCKRNMDEECSDLSQDDVVSSKRARQTSVAAKEVTNESLQKSPDSVQINLPLISSTTSRDGSSGPVQQLVSMFGALVAQGDKAAGSLEILVSSITCDLLAEVVIANMQHLPPTCPEADGKEELISGLGYASGFVSNSLPALRPSVLASDILSLSSSLPMLASLLNIQPSASYDISKIQQGDEEKMTATTDATFSPSSVGDVIATTSASLPASVEPSELVTEKDGTAVPLYANMETTESKIPGLDSTSSFDEIQESQDASHTSTAELQETNLGHAVNLVSTMRLDASTTDCEAQSPQPAITDASQLPCIASVTTAPQYILPKMTVTNVDLTDEDKDHLQKVAFMRILEAYKQIAISGGSQIHFPLLSHLGVEYPLELDTWGLLQKHVLSDYMNHEGHELTLRVLYRLYREAEQDQDFFSSRTATSVYETFLLAVAETLHDTFPALDKSLSRLLGEVPYLPEGVLKLLERLCSPENERHEKDFQSGDRVTQGLSAVWNLILLRPSNRDRCLQIALQSAVHPVEEVRMKAIRLVANKLFPMPSISQKIEVFASEKLQSVADDIPATEDIDADGSALGLQKNGDLEKPPAGRQPPPSLDKNELTSDNPLDQNTTSSSISEAQRCISLYFALCTKKHSLLRRIFAIYKCIPKAAKQAVHRHIPILVRTIGTSPELLGIISDPPTGSESLLMLVLQTLTDGVVPSQDLISSVKKLYHSKFQDVDILIPVLSFLSKDEILPIFPQIVNLPLDKFQAGLTRMLQGSPHTGPCLSPPEILIAIHGIDPEKDKIPLKKVMDACSACFEQQNVFTQQVLAKVLNQLVEQIPLPLLFMRTVIQAIGVFPALVDFVMEILSRLINKQIWKYPKLWVGFLKCAIQTKPQSFSVLLQLPAPQLENALTRNPMLRAPLAEHANQPNIRSTLPRSTLVVLGLVQDSQASGPAQTSQSQAAETGSSAADVATEVTQESTAVS
ncbi:symplekin isoform X2 [Phoenix dactylifera]|uniref:Symplekin isoform X2 n=1 Tax=Phoenix dactylifera TaxID=42345 RepID=A0A8B8J5F1_PHODC|nr:symplekin isoform X2 [Phoenix dactylifera]